MFFSSNEVILPALLEITDNGLIFSYFQKDRVKAKATIIEAGGSNDIRYILVYSLLTRLWFFSIAVN